MNTARDIFTPEQAKDLKLREHTGEEVSDFSRADELDKGVLPQHVKYPSLH